MIAEILSRIMGSLENCYGIFSVMICGGNSQRIAMNSLSHVTEFLCKLKIIIQFLISSVYHMTALFL